MKGLRQQNFRVLCINLAETISDDPSNFWIGVFFFAEWVISSLKSHSLKIVSVTFGENLIGVVDIAFIQL